MKGLQDLNGQRLDKLASVLGLKVSAETSKDGVTGQFDSERLSDA